MKSSKTLKELHIELWTWLSENPDLEKRNWPGWKDIIEEGKIYDYGTALLFECFSCQAATKEGLRDCSLCPCLKIFKTKRKLQGCPCIEDHSPYQRWRNMSSSNIRVKLAKKIAEGWEGE